MFKLIATRVPNRFAVLLTIGEYGPMYLSATEMNLVIEELEKHYIEMIGQGYEGYTERIHQ